MKIENIDEPDWESNISIKSIKIIILQYWLLVHQGDLCPKNVLVI